jgi:hypothetical protein
VKEDKELIELEKKIKRKKGELNKKEEKLKEELEKIKTLQKDIKGLEEKRILITVEKSNVSYQDLKVLLDVNDK